MPNYKRKLLPIKSRIYECTCFPFSPVILNCNTGQSSLQKFQFDDLTLNVILQLKACFGIAICSITRFRRLVDRSFKHAHLKARPFICIVSNYSMKFSI